MQQGNILAELMKYMGVQPESMTKTMQQYGGTLPALVMQYILANREEPRTLQEGAEYITRGMQEGGGFLPGATIGRAASGIGKLKLLSSETPIKQAPGEAFVAAKMKSGEVYYAPKTDINSHHGLVLEGLDPFEVQRLGFVIRGKFYGEGKEAFEAARRSRMGLDLETGEWIPLE